jgi:transcriptional regulator with XRE-family HTH domain
LFLRALSPKEPEHAVIGETLRSLRLRLEKTQEQLALDVRISNSEISRLEKGWRNPKWETMKRLARGLEVPLWQVVWLGEQLEAGVSWDDVDWPPRLSE